MSASITLDKDYVIASVGDWITLTPTVTKTEDVTWDFNDHGLIWKTSNPNVAIVNDGQVNIVGKGLVTITVSVRYDNYALNGRFNNMGRYFATCLIFVG